MKTLTSALLSPFNIDLIREILLHLELPGTDRTLGQDPSHGLVLDLDLSIDQNILLAGVLVAVSAVLFGILHALFVIVVTGVPMR